MPRSPGGVGGRHRPSSPSGASQQRETAPAAGASGIEDDLRDEAASRALGVNRTDHRVLDVIERAGRITAGRLAEEAGLSPAAMTASIDRLEEAGYASRVPDPEDRRRILVEITPSARKRAWEIYGPMKEAFVGEMSRYPRDFLEWLADHLGLGAKISAEQRKRIDAIKPPRHKLRSPRGKEPR